MAADVVTWGRLRAPIGNGFTAFIGGPTFNNAEYTSPVFVSDPDLSPLRTYYNAFFTFAFPFANPFFDIVRSTNSNFGMGPNPYSLIPDDAVNQLIGETVTLTPIAHTFVITSPAFDTNGQNTGFPPSAITAIGKLTIV